MHRYRGSPVSTSLAKIALPWYNVLTLEDNESNVKIWWFQILFMWPTKASIILQWKVRPGSFNLYSFTRLDLQLECQMYPILFDTHYASLVIITCLKAVISGVSVDWTKLYWNMLLPNKLLCKTNWRMTLITQSPRFRINRSNHL